MIPFIQMFHCLWNACERSLQERETLSILRASRRAPSHALFFLSSFLFCTFFSCFSNLDLVHALNSVFDVNFPPSLTCAVRGLFFGTCEKVILCA